MSPPATIPAPWSWSRGVGERSRMVTLWPRRLRTMPVRRPPREPPTTIAVLEVDMGSIVRRRGHGADIEVLLFATLRDADLRHLRPAVSAP